jgi:hypothetical protein
LISLRFFQNSGLILLEAELTGATQSTKSDFNEQKSTSDDQDSTKRNALGSLINSRYPHFHLVFAQHIVVF